MVRVVSDSEGIRSMTMFFIETLIGRFCPEGIITCPEPGGIFTWIRASLRACAGEYMHLYNYGI